LVPVELLAKLSRGVNVSRWFRYPASDSEHHYRGFITDADLDLIVSMGVTSVRLAVDPRYLHLGLLDEAVGRLVGRDLAVVLDYHDESRAIESGPAAVAALERTWAGLAARLAQFPPERLLLEIVNEPVFDRNPAAWFPIRRRVASVIRGAAPLHTIVAGATNWSSLDGLLRSEPLEDDNVLYTFHFYEPFEFTHQGAPWVDGPVGWMRGVRYPETPRAAGHVGARVAAAAEWGARHNVPVWCGEFGAYPPHRAGAPSHRLGRLELRRKPRPGPDRRPRRARQDRPGERRRARLARPGRRRMTAERRGVRVLS